MSVGGNSVSIEAANKIKICPAPLKLTSWCREKCLWGRGVMSLLLLLSGSSLSLKLCFPWFPFKQGLLVCWKSKSEFHGPCLKSLTNATLFNFTCTLKSLQQLCWLKSVVGDSEGTGHFRVLPLSCLVLFERENLTLLSLDNIYSYCIYAAKEKTA